MQDLIGLAGHSIEQGRHHAGLARKRQCMPSTCLSVLTALSNSGGRYLTEQDKTSIGHELPLLGRMLRIGEESFIVGFVLF